MTAQPASSRPPEGRPPEGDKPLDGINVLDFCWVAVGPMTTKYLGEYGATVVRVESAKRPGTLRRAEGLRSARSVPGVEDVTITMPRGQAVVPLPEGSRYLGFIFAKGDTPGAVEAALREAHGRLRFTIDGRPGGGGMRWAGAAPVLNQGSRGRRRAGVSSRGCL